MSSWFKCRAAGSFEFKKKHSKGKYFIYLLNTLPDDIYNLVTTYIGLASIFQQNNKLLNKEENPSTEEEQPQSKKKLIPIYYFKPITTVVTL